MIGTLDSQSKKKKMQLVSHKVIQKQLTNVTQLSFLLHSGTNLFFLLIAHSFFPRAGQVDVLTWGFFQATYLFVS